MKLIAISGSWRKMDSRVERDVRREAGKIMRRGDGIVTGGALGVDFIATDEALKRDSKAKRIKIILPSSFASYAWHMKKRMKEGTIPKKTCARLLKQLEKIRKANPSALVEMKGVAKGKHVTQKQYYKRNSEVIKTVDGLVAFRVNESKGTQDAIEKAKRKGIAVKVFSYSSP
ncbi:MAG: hypothetical protein V1717_04060 [Candidatus Micrarchaeota archaeon]